MIGTTKKSSSIIPLRGSVQTVGLTEFRQSTPDFERLFCRHYDEIRWSCLQVAEQGVAVFAVHTQTWELSGRLILRADPLQPVTGIVGRHSTADLRLEESRGLSLRHLMFMVEPMPRGELRYRLVDLSGGQGFRDESGRKLEHIVAGGPTFVQCGEYALLILLTGEVSCFPCDALCAWSLVPERVYLQDIALHRYLPRFVQRPRSIRGRSATHISAIRGPALVCDDGSASYARRSDDGGEGRSDESAEEGAKSPLGRLCVSSPHGECSVLLDEECARKGLIIGREKCSERGVQRLLQVEGVSGVHALIILIDGGLYFIDTGSSYGCHLLARRAPLANSRLAEGSGRHQLTQQACTFELQEDTLLLLGKGLARLRWKWT